MSKSKSHPCKHPETACKIDMETMTVVCKKCGGTLVK